MSSRTSGGGVVAVEDLAAAARSIASRATYMSRTSSGVMSITNSPRLRMETSSPSWVSRCIPSRSGPRLTPSLPGQLGLTQLGAWLEFAVTDGLAQLLRDDARRRLLGQRRRCAGHALVSEQRAEPGQRRHRPEQLAGPSTR